MKSEIKYIIGKYVYDINIGSAQRVFYDDWIINSVVKKYKDNTNYDFYYNRPICIMDVDLQYTDYEDELTGMIITEKGMAFFELLKDPINIHFDDIISIELKESSDEDRLNILHIKTLHLDIKFESPFYNKKPLKRMIEEIIKYRRTGSFNGSLDQEEMLIKEIKHLRRVVEYLLEERDGLYSKFLSELNEYEEKILELENGRINSRLNYNVNNIEDGCEEEIYPLDEFMIENGYDPMNDTVEDMYNLD